MGSSSSRTANHHKELNTTPTRIFVPEDFLELVTEQLTPTFDALSLRINSEIARLCTLLSTEEDCIRLLGMEAIYASNQGQLLSFSDENETFSLVDAIGNGDIPRQAMFLAPYTSFRDFMGEMTMKGARECLKPPGGDCTRGELSTTLSKYLFPLDEDVIHVQLRSAVPYFSSCETNLKVVFGNMGGGDAGDYCLAACNDGTVKWLPQSKCRNGNHIWTVYLFDPPSDPEGEVHISQRLRRRGTVGDNNHVNVINNNNFGGNNNESGSQSIGTINYQTALNLNLPRTH